MLNNTAAATRDIFRMTRMKGDINQVVEEIKSWIEKIDDLKSGCR